MLDTAILIFGISGALSIALNFLLEATNKLGKDHKTFAWINLYGSVSLLTYSWYNQVWLFVGLNIFTTLVGIYGLFVVYSKKK